MKKSSKIILIIIVSLIIILLSIKITSDLIYKYKYEPCMEHKLEPVYDGISDTWSNECPEGCHLDACFGIKTACCPD
jgi:hypothetical protein